MMMLQRKTCTPSPSLKVIILHAPKKKQNESRSRNCSTFAFLQFQKNGIHFPPLLSCTSTLGLSSQLSVHCLSGSYHCPRRKQDISPSSLIRTIPILIHSYILLDLLYYRISLTRRYPKHTYIHTNPHLG